MEDSADQHSTEQVIRDCKTSGMVAADSEEDSSSDDKVADGDPDSISDEEIPFGLEIDSDDDDEFVHPLSQIPVMTLLHQSDVAGRLVYGIKGSRKSCSMRPTGGSTPKTPTVSTGAVPKKGASSRAENSMPPNKLDELYASTNNQSRTRTSGNREHRANLSKMSAERKGQMALAGKQPLPEYIVQSDEYFTSHTSAKATTSDKTLDRLHMPVSTHMEVNKLLATNDEPGKHALVVETLLNEYNNMFAHFTFILNEGYNLVLYGVGSKRSMLEHFQNTELINEHVVVVNGFFPDITPKDLLDAVACNLLKLDVTTANIPETLNAIDDNLSLKPDMHIFLIVHNIDAEAMRNHRMQTVLCRLANITSIHLITTVDTISAQLAWDTSHLSVLNFFWVDITTMLPYAVETSFETSLQLQSSNTLAISAARNVFASLTTNARGVFMSIVRYQLKNGGRSQPNYQGMPLKDLYWSCREAFLVSSDVALRTQLTEFTDHKLLRIKRLPDGAENLLIPLENSLLQRFVEQEAN